MSDQTSPDSINRDRAVNPAAATNRVGGWLFRHRTSIPLPFVLAIVLLPAGDAAHSAGLVALGVAITLLGEALRVWGVHHIGVISRTRSDRLGPLVATGPFAILRNPLYVGNIAIWVGFALAAGLVWLAPLVVVFLGVEYHQIVKWEEQLLESRLGDRYRAYAAQVNRWLPVFTHRVDGRGAGRDREHGSTDGSGKSWPETLFSERGTLIAIAAGYLLLWLKARVLLTSYFVLFLLPPS
jgi:protein-S-isoprenylcysteine O-methyltransferase Ste14